MPTRSHTGPQPLGVVVVGQTPPPLGGQAIAIDSFVRGEYDAIRPFLVRMGFSADMAEVGKFRIAKVAHLLALIARILVARIRTGARILYYPPAGPDLVPLLRDLVILLSTRWAFERTVFHFHAGGLSTLYGRLPGWLRPLFWRAYGKPDVGIQPSELNPPDSAFLKARQTVIVPGGVTDLPREQLLARGGNEQLPVLLYAGVLRESKGLLTLVAAVDELQRRGKPVRVRLMGEFESPAFEKTLRAAPREEGVAELVEFLGTCSGAAKERAFAEADIFCYPTYFESETFGLVLVEAMRASLPIVATNWRGVPSVVHDGYNGFLVAPNDPAALADRLQALLDDPETARRMGQSGRLLYEQRYTEDQYRQRMQAAVLLACQGKS